MLFFSKYSNSKTDGGVTLAHRVYSLQVSKD
jgi:hypothetical protein